MATAATQAENTALHMTQLLKIRLLDYYLQIAITTSQVTSHKLYENRIFVYSPVMYAYTS